MKWHVKGEPDKTVDIFDFNAELRIGEIKHRVVVYYRKDKLFVRKFEEFCAKFERAKEDKP